MKNEVKAFVRCEDTAKLERKLPREIKVLVHHSNYAFFEKGNIYFIDKSYFKYDKSYIDCNAYTPNGTEEEAEELFLELISMKPLINTQSFVRWEQDIFLYPIDHLPVIVKGSITRLLTMIDCRADLYTPLTPLEIAQAFKDGEIDLLKE